MSKFKVGDRVRLARYTSRSSLIKSEHERRIHGGNSGVVERVDENDRVLPYDVRFNNEPGTDGHDWCTEAMLEPMAPLAPLTKEQKAIAKAEADLQALKDRAAKKAQQAAERKAKAERAKLMRGLSPAGRRVVELLKAKPDLLGCQTKNAAELASAITGDDAEKIRKALA